MPISSKELQNHYDLLRTREYNVFELYVMNDIIDLIDKGLKNNESLKINISESIFDKLNNNEIHRIIKDRIITDILNKYRNIGWCIKLKYIFSDYGKHVWYEFCTIEQTLSFKIKRFFNNLFK